MPEANAQATCPGETRVIPCDKLGFEAHWCDWGNPVFGPLYKVLRLTNPFFDLDRCARGAIFTDVHTQTQTACGWATKQSFGDMVCPLYPRAEFPTADPEWLGTIAKHRLVFTLPGILGTVHCPNVEE
jgi:hypothetical protein